MQLQLKFPANEIYNYVGSRDQSAIAVFLDLSIYTTHCKRCLEELQAEGGEEGTRQSRPNINCRLNSSPDGEEVGPHTTKLQMLY